MDEQGTMITSPPFTILHIFPTMREQPCPRLPYRNAGDHIFLGLIFSHHLDLWHHLEQLLNDHRAVTVLIVLTHAQQHQAIALAQVRDQPPDTNRFVSKLDRTAFIVDIAQVLPNDIVRYIWRGAPLTPILLYYPLWRYQKYGKEYIAGSLQASDAPSKCQPLL
jgi:hypothetical protein